MSIFRSAFGKVNKFFSLLLCLPLRKASEGGLCAPCDFTLLSEVNPVRKSLTGQAGLSNGVKDERKKI